MEKPIVLVGLPGSGKSTLGKQMAHGLALKFLDLDVLLETSFGCSISEFFSQSGEGLFRQEEHNLLYKILTSVQERFVLATGGGTPCFHDNMGIIKQHGLSIYLETPWPIITSRLHKKSGGRPLLSTMENDIEIAEAYLKEKFAWRIPFYQQADIVVPISGNTTQDIVGKIIGLVS